MRLISRVLAGSFAFAFVLWWSPSLFADEPLPRPLLPVQRFCELELSLGDAQVRPEPSPLQSAVAHGIWDIRYRTGFSEDSETQGAMAEMQGLVRQHRGFIIAPEHVSPNDPPLLLLKLADHQIYPRPMMDANQVNAPLIGGLIRRSGAGVGAILVPLGIVGGKTQASLVSGVINIGVNTIRSGGPILFYPSGRIKTRAEENLYAASMLTEFLRREPDVPVFLIRQRGLWGSRMSLGSPDLPEGQTTGAAGLLKSGIFNLPAALVLNAGQLPKREVTYFAKRADPEILKQMLASEDDVGRINRYVESYFTPPDERTFVPLWPWERPQGVHALPSVDRTGVRAKNGDDLMTADDGEVIEAKYVDAVVDSYRRVKGLDKNSPVDPYTSTENIDSLDQVMFLGQLEDDFHVTFNREKFNPRTLRDVAFILQTMLTETNPAATENEHKMSDGWKANPKPDVPLVMADGATVTEKFVNSALDHPSMVITEGKEPMTYGDLLTKAEALSFVLENEFPADRIGILFPAHEKLPLAYHAAHLAGKTPVLMDFTGSPTFLEKMFKGDERILTSKLIVNQVGKEYDLSHILHRFVYVEDLKFKIAAQLPRAMLMTNFRTSLLERARRTKTAAVLFTSGSSGDPKEVSITQAMMLANMGGLVDLFNSGSYPLITGRVRLLNFLPPFHSFGHFFLNLQLSFGIPTVYYPKPNDYKTLVKMIGAAGVTALGATPTFAEGLARVGSEKDLANVEILILGAEAPKDAQIQLIRQKFTNPKLVILCGYGMTEASPVISVNIPDHNDLSSVGVILPNIDYLIVDQETLEPVARGQEGELLVAGESLFNGYGNNPEDPFVERAGRDGKSKRFVHTKDLVVEGPEVFRGGEIDQGAGLGRGLIYIKGRMGDQVKRGGDKVQPPALENDFANFFTPFKQGDNAPPNFAISTAGNNKELVLFTTVEGLRLEDLLELQQTRPGREKINRVVVLPEIPVTGATQKINRKALKALCAEKYSFEWPAVR